MWNDILQRIDSAQTPKNAVKQWGGAATSIHLVNEGIHLVYRFEQNGQVDYLRLTLATLLSKLQNGSGQNITVEQVNVSDGGQAIIGSVNAPNRQ